MVHQIPLKKYQLFLILETKSLISMAVGRFVGSRSQHLTMMVLNSDSTCKNES